MIPINKPHFDKDELNEVQSVLDSGWVTKGPKVEEFEEDIENYLGVKYAIAVTNCTSALHLSLLAVGITNWDSVIVSDFTFPATAHAVLYCGANPIFVDVDRKTYNINSALIEKNIEEDTKAIIPVHTFGQSCDMDEIFKIVDRYPWIKIIEDAACAFGAKYKGRFVGTFGDVGCFSLHGRKGITTGEGGIVVTNNKQIADRVRKLSVFGIQKDVVTELGYNYKMSDITAAVGISQLRKLDKIIKRKREHADRYNELLKDIDLIKIPYIDKNVYHIYQSYVIIINKSIDRNLLSKKLLKKGIETRFGTYACHSQPIYKSLNKCSVSLDLFNRSLSLPLFYDLERKDIRKIVKELKQSLEELC